MGERQVADDWGDIQVWVRRKWSSLYGQQTPDYRHPDEPLYGEALEFFNEPTPERQQALIQVLAKETQAIGEELAAIPEEDPDKGTLMRDIAKRTGLLSRVTKYLESSNDRTPNR